MFDKKLPVTESEKMTFPVQHQHSPESGQQAPQIRLQPSTSLEQPPNTASTYTGDQIMFQSQPLGKPAQHFGPKDKKMYPG